MIHLVGLGIWDEKDISVRGMNICGKADEVYAELYTAAWGGSLESLGKMIGKDIIPLERKGVEEESEKLIKKAGNKDVVLLVPGDPLVATTHLHLLAEAGEKGIPFRIVHSSSVLTAVGRTGLQLYKFGRVVTIPSPEENYSPDSFYGAIEKNLEAGLHSLLLLDRDLDTSKATEILLKAGKGRWKRISSEKKIVFCSRLGSEDEKIIYGKAESVSESLPSPAVIIVPGDLHFSEEEYLRNFETG